MFNLSTFLYCFIYGVVMAQIFFGAIGLQASAFNVVDTFYNVGFFYPR
jgi:hypothetical protein